MTFKTQIMGGQLCVRVKTAPYEKMDGNELNRFSQLSLEGFLRPKAYPNYLIDYVGPMGVSLYEILKRPISKKDYLYILEQIVAAVQRIQANGLNVGYVVMFPYQIYVNYLTKEVNFIYFPSNNFQNFNLVQLFEFVVSTVKMVDPKDRVFALDFAKFIKDLKPFDTNKIEALIAREDSEVVAMVKKTPINNVVNVPNAVQQPSEKIEEGTISINADVEDIVPEPKVELVEIEAEIMEVQDVKKPEIDEVVEEIIDEPVEEFAPEIVLDEVNELEDEIFEIVDDTGILDCVENDVVDIIDQIAEETEKYEEIVAVEDVEETIDDVVDMFAESIDEEKVVDEQQIDALEDEDYDDAIDIFAQNMFIDDAEFIDSLDSSEEADDEDYDDAIDIFAGI